MMKVIQLTHGEETEIQCHTISAPNESEPVVIQWMKNGRNIYKGNAKYIELSMHTVFILMITFYVS